MKTKKRKLTVTGSHEQTAGSSTGSCLQLLDKKDRLGIEPSWPWAISRCTPTKTISGAALGAAQDGSPTTKRWTFESNNTFLLEVFDHYKRPHVEKNELLPIWAEKGRAGAGSANSEKYPTYLGHVMAAALAYYSG